MSLRKPGLVVLCSLVALIALTGICGSPTYYVDEVIGLDTNNGTSPVHAWKTIAKVNSFTFPAASSVYFAGGETFVGCPYFKGSSGGNMAAGGPTLVTSYGVGRATISPNCSGSFIAGATFDGVNNFTWSNLNLAGQTSSKPPGTYEFLYPALEAGTDSVIGTTQVLGQTFIPQVTGTVSGGWWMKPPGSTTNARNIILWSCATSACTSGTNVAQCTTSETTVSTNTWVGCSFPSAYTITPRNSYIISADVPGTDDFVRCPLTGGSNPCVSPSSLLVMSLGQNAYYSGALSTFPASSWNAQGAYMVDVAFTSTQSASAPLTAIGIMVENTGGAPSSQIAINTCDISNFGNLADGFNAGEIYYTSYNGPLDHLSVTNCTLHGLTATAIDWQGIGGIGGHSMTNFNFSGNEIYNIGGGTGGNGPGATVGSFGIQIADINGATVENNKVHDIGANANGCGGPGAIEVYQSDSILIQFNEDYNVRALPSYTSGCDFTGFDLDGGTTNSIVQYNYSHDNAGAGYIVYIFNPSGYTWGGNIIRFNISENDHSQYPGGSIETSYTTPLGTIKWYNNTVYVSWNSSIGGANFCFKESTNGGNFPAGSVFENNECYSGSNSNANFMACCAVSANQGLTFSGNNYYAGAGGTPDWEIYYPSHTFFTTLSAWQAATGQDSTATISNPLLTSPGTGGTCSWTPSLTTTPQPCPSAYNLQSTAPTKSVGANLLACPIGGSTSTLGLKDYFGNSILSLCGS